jgi:hypothetical protein
MYIRQQVKAGKRQNIHGYMLAVSAYTIVGYGEAIW